VLSVVTEQIGNGPFNLVVEGNVFFPEHIDLQSRISAFAGELNLGALTIRTANAKLWSPRPNWEELQTKKDHILTQLTRLPILNDLECCGFDIPLEGIRHQRPLALQSLLSNFSSALVIGEIGSLRIIASQIAGLGAGLTPAGDDFLIGSIYAAWVIHPTETASTLARQIADTAAPRTTSLSAAWLRSAGRGEAGAAWHGFLDALSTGSAEAVQLQTDRILSIGHTSGADALAGFLCSFRGYIFGG
jgi:hypothetical protein